MLVPRHTYVVRLLMDAANAVAHRFIWPCSRSRDHSLCRCLLLVQGCVYFALYFIFVACEPVYRANVFFKIQAQILRYALGALFTYCISQSCLYPCLAQA